MRRRVQARGSTSLPIPLVTVTPAPTLALHRPPALSLKPAPLPCPPRGVAGPLQAMGWLGGPWPGHDERDTMATMVTLVVLKERVQGCTTGD